MKNKYMKNNDNVTLIMNNGIQNEMFIIFYKR
jgi:hypothetical protein